MEILWVVLTIVLYVLYDAIIVPKIEQRREDKKWEEILIEYNKTALIKAKIA